MIYFTDDDFDFDNINKLLNESGFNFLGLCSEKLNKHICKESLNNQDIYFIVYKNKEFAGYIFCVKNYRSFIINFLIRHPTIGFEVVYRKLHKKVNVRSDDVVENDRISINDEKSIPDKLHIEKVNSDSPSWQEMSKDIAKIVLVFVRINSRGKGIGKLMYSFLLEKLSQDNVIRLDASVDKSNLSSVALHSSIKSSRCYDYGESFLFSFKL